jgi:hypothetical protein
MTERVTQKWMAPISWRTHEIVDAVLQWLAWRLPRRLVMWCAIRLIAHATQGRYGDTVVPELTAMDALQRWDAKEPWPADTPVDPMPFRYVS